MSQIGSTEALEKYLQLEKQNKILLDENHFQYEEIKKLRKQWSELAGKINTVYNWLDSRENTKTQTIRHKMAETFGFAYMEAMFEDLRVKWKNQESIEWARKEYPVLENTSHEEAKPE